MYGYYAFPRFHQRMNHPRTNAMGMAQIDSNAHLAYHHHIYEAGWMLAYISCADVQR